MFAAPVVNRGVPGSLRHLFVQNQHFQPTVTGPADEVFAERVIHARGNGVPRSCQRDPSTGDMAFL